MSSAHLKIVFVAHEDTVTGAPIALLGLLKTLSESGAFNVDVCVINKTGKLFSEYSRHASEVFTPFVGQTLYKRLQHRFLQNDTIYSTLVKKLSEYDVVVINTIVALNYFRLPELRAFRNLALCIFEMPLAIRIMLGENVVKLSALKLIYSPSPILTKHLKEEFDVAAQIAPLNQYIDVDALSVDTELLPSEPGTSPDKPFRVCMIGAYAWSKAMEYFLCIAKHFTGLYPQANVQFVWKGLSKESAEYAIFKSDVEKAGLDEVFVFEGKTETIGAFYESLDVLALSSREDTYPNIMIEAALFSKPTICFQSSGGAEILVGSYGGFIVPFLDIAAYCEAIYVYYSDRQLLRQHGASARSYVMEHNCDRSLMLAQFKAGLERLQLLENQPELIKG